MKPSRFALGEVVRIVNASRLWGPHNTPMPIGMVVQCFLGRMGRVKHTAFDHVVTIELIGRRSETRICGMPEAPGLDSDAITELFAEESALRRVPVIDALAALDA